MRDEYACLVMPQLVEAVEDILLRHRVEGGRRLVQYQYVRIGVERPRYGELLPLTYGELRAVRLEIAHEGGIVAGVELIDEHVRSGAPCGVDHLGLARVALDIAEDYVLARCDGVFAEVLEYHAEHVVELLDVVLADIMPVEQHRSAGGIVEPCKELDERRLAGAVEADYDDRLAALDREVDVL